MLYSPIILRSGIGALISNKYVAKQNLETIIDKLFYHLHQYWGFFTSGYSDNIKTFLFFLFFIGIVNHVFNKNTRNLFFSFVFTALTIFFVLKRLPFDRTLLFIYPIFWTYIASGVFSTIKFISEKVNYSINSFSYIGAIIVFLFTTSICLYNKGIVETYKDQTCVEAEKIITEIKRVLTTNDKIETSTPLAGPLRYYLLKNNISEETLHWHSKGKDKSNLLESNRTFIITRNGRNNLESFGYNQTQSIPGFSKPKLWKKYKNTVTVYIIEKYL